MYIDPVQSRIDSNELNHHGILGMKWGIRRYQPYPKGYSGEGKEVGEAAKSKKKQKMTWAEKKEFRNNAAKTLGASNWYSLNKKYSEKSIKRMLDNVNNKGMTINEAKKKERVAAMGRVIGKTALWAAVFIPTIAFLNSQKGQNMIFSAVKAADSRKNNFDDLTDVLVRKSTSTVKNDPFGKARWDKIIKDVNANTSPIKSPPPIKRPQTLKPDPYNAKGWDRILKNIEDNTSRRR